MTKTEKPVPFETEVEFDPNLPAGEKVVDQKGELGTEVETSTQKLIDGKPSGDPTVTTERTKEPTTEKIRVGTKTTGEIVNSVETEVPFGVKIEFDPNMPAGTSEVVTEGKPGKKTVTVTQKVTSSQPDGEATVEEKVTEQPVDQVIKVGTKPSEASKKVTWTAQIPFEVETRPNPELKPGEIRVVQKGVPGEKTYTADFTAKGDQATVTPEEKQTKDPVNEIIEYGPAAEDTEVVTKVEKPVPFDTEIVFDNTLEEGEQVVDQQGETGTEVVTSTQKIKDGKPDGKPTVTTERTKEPTKQIIRVGTMTEGTYTTESEIPVPFETEIQFDDTLPAGEQQVVQEGKLGKDKVTTTQTIVNSKVTDVKTESKRVEEPVKKIIKVGTGTKGKPASTTVEWTETTPFEVEVRVNPDLKPGETKIVQGGKPGEVKHTVKVNANNGEISTDESSEKISDPVKQIIEVGPAKANKTELTDKHTEKIPFETVIEYDPNLEVGKVVEDQAGAFGEKEVSKTWKLEDGKPVGDPETSEKVLKKPQPRKVRVGTKPAATTGEVTKVLETEVPFKVKVIYDPTIPAGETKVDTEGKPGKKEVTITQKVTNSNPDGEATVTEKVIEEPVDHVIRVGTKTAAAEENVEWKESIPYPTTVRTNPALAPGEVKVVQEGKNGEVKYSAKFTAVNGETAIEQSQDRTEPVERIIEVGPKLPPQDWKHKTTARLPFETVVVIDNNLEAGKKVIDQKGVEGEETITITQKIVNGQPVGDADETREQTKAPVKQIIRVGGKSVCDCSKMPNPKPNEPSPMPTQPPSRKPNPDGQGSPSVHPTPKPGVPSTGVAGMADTLVATCLTAVMCLGVALAAVFRRRSRS